MASAAIRAWPLAALGVSRLVVIKGLGYQEHVSEYGVHWNFFATLFFMRLVVVPVNRICPVRLRSCLALAAIGVYQWFLVKGGLSDFIVHAPRDTLFAMNREGVLGLVGFVAIYYIAEELGSQIQAQRQTLDKVSPDAFSCPEFSEQRRTTQDNILFCVELTLPFNLPSSRLPTVRPSEHEHRLWWRDTSCLLGVATLIASPTKT